MKLLAIELITTRYAVRIAQVDNNAVIQYDVFISDEVEDETYIIMIDGLHSMLTFLHFATVSGDAHITDFIKLNS